MDRAARWDADHSVPSWGTSRRGRFSLVSHFQTCKILAVSQRKERGKRKVWGKEEEDEEGVGKGGTSWKGWEIAYKKPTTAKWIFEVFCNIMNLMQWLSDFDVFLREITKGIATKFFAEDKFYRSEIEETYLCMHCCWSQQWVVKCYCAFRDTPPQFFCLEEIF